MWKKSCQSVAVPALLPDNCCKEEEMEEEKEEEKGKEEEGEKEKEKKKR